MNRLNFEHLGTVFESRSSDRMNRRVFPFLPPDIESNVDIRHYKAHLKDKPTKLGKVGLSVDLYETFTLCAVCFDQVSRAAKIQLRKSFIPALHSAKRH